MPYIKTAFLGSPGAPVLPQGDVINHFNMVRVRVTGVGILQPIMYSKDNVRSSTLPNITMQSDNEFSPVSLANFMTERMSLKLYTDEINEVFRIQRITIYSRPTWTMIPG